MSILLRFLTKVLDILALVSEGWNDVGYGWINIRVKRFSVNSGVLTQVKIDLHYSEGLCYIGGSINFGKDLQFRKPKPAIG